MLEPYREGGYRRLMQAHAAAGDSAEALRVYERCRRLLADELGAYPSAETESIYRDLLRAPAPEAPAARPETAPSAVEPERAGGSEKPAGAIARRSRLTRRKLLLAALAGAIAVAAALSIFTHGRGSEPDAPVTGTWESVDSDGSHQTINVSRGAEEGTYDLTLEDDDAQEACGGGPVTGKGPLTVAGNELLVEIVLDCASGTRLEVPVRWTYRDAGDKLVGLDGVVWSRVKVAGNG